MGWDEVTSQPIKRSPPDSRATDGKLCRRVGSQVPQAHGLTLEAAEAKNLTSDDPTCSSAGLMFSGPRVPK